MVVSVDFNKYKERQCELIQLNHEQKQSAKPIILLSPNQILEVWKTTDKENFKFVVLSKHITKKIIRYGSNKTLSVGFKVENDVIKYYVIQDITLKDKTCLVTVTCPATEKKLLMGRFAKYKPL